MISSDDDHDFDHYDEDDVDDDDYVEKDDSWGDNNDMDDEWGSGIEHVGEPVMLSPCMGWHTWHLLSCSRDPVMYSCCIMIV